MHVERLQSFDKRVERALKRTQLSQQPTTTRAQGQLMLDNSFPLRKAVPPARKTFQGTGGIGHTHRERRVRVSAESPTPFPAGFQPDYPKSLGAPARLAPALSPAAAPRAPLALPRHSRSGPLPSDSRCRRRGLLTDGSEPLVLLARRVLPAAQRGAQGRQPLRSGRAGPGGRQSSHHGTDGGESPHRHQRLHPPPAAAILGRD